MVFIVMLCGIFDLGRGVYLNNALSEAAREIARVTSVHPGSPLGSSTQTATAVSGQRGLVPGLATPTYSCVDIDGSSIAGACRPGDWVKVRATTTWTPVTPFLSFLGTMTFSASSSIQIP
jgi:hypothetical protein